MKRFLALLLLGLLMPLPGQAAEPPGIPPDLQPWKDWVLARDDLWRCPLQADDKTRICAWPGTLRLDLDARGARFSQRWQVHRRSAVPLPGSAGQWPSAVRVDGKPTPVVAQGKRPVVWLEAGNHRIRGRIDWATPPSSLAIPPQTALLAVYRDGHRLDLPRDAAGRLWLQPPPSTRRGPTAKPGLHLQVWRRLQDDIPLRLETRIRLRVSGPPRERVIPLPLPAGFTPWQLHAPLPARLEPGNRLRLQLRPGTWDIRLLHRSNGPVEDLSLPPAEAPWPESEVWALAPGPTREAELAGVPRADPRQAELPAGWQRLPAWRIRPGQDHPRLVTLQRHDASRQHDALTLQRDVWIDFDGEGATLRDRIQGTLRATWRLDTMPRLALGRVSADGQERLITRLPDNARPGVEIRARSLALEAVSRIEDPARLPANGWNLPMQQASATLHLPPGWRLVALSGSGRASHSWLQRWTLLDLFLVLIFAIALWRLYGLGWGLLGLLALALAWHEPGSPHYLWLNLLAAAALVRILPAGRAQSLARGYRLLSLALLLLWLLPFSVQMVRTAIYPQLEAGAIPVPRAAVPRAESKHQPAPRMTVRKEGIALAATDRAEPGLPESPARPQTKPAVEPHRQSGPALPEWEGTRIHLRWNGPVDPDELTRPWLLGPRTVMLLKLLATLLGLVLALRLIDAVRLPRIPAPPAAGTTALLALALLTCGSTSPARADEIPGPELLEELRQRLLAPPPCRPRCVDLHAVRIYTEGNTLGLELELHAAARAAYALPRIGGGWVLRSARLDGQPAFVLRDARGQGEVVLEAGIRRLYLQGRIDSAADALDIDFRRPPRHLRLDLQDWAAGDALAPPPAQLHLQRRHQAQTAAPEPKLEPGHLPALVEVRRTLHLGLAWTATTRIHRSGPADSAVHLNLPLLPGEAPLQEVPVARGRMTVTLAPGQRDRLIRSRLEIRPELRLQAAEDSLPADGDGWYEIWEVAPGPQWHLQHQGLPVLPDDERGPQRRLQWRPWPGESVTLHILRPEAVPGPTLTLQRLGLERRVGAQASEVTLSVHLHATEGQHWRPRLPADARLQAIRLDDRLLPLPEGRQVDIAIPPGRHRVEMRWRDAGRQGLLTRTPAFEAGLPLANVRLGLQPGENRWILLAGGPGMGPAVLYWGVILVLAVLALVLGRSRLTPLGSGAWFLLGIGLSQAPPLLGLAVAGWLLALGLRQRRHPTHPGLHNAMQLALALYTLIAILLLFLAVRQGLLGQPEMMISGAGSTAEHLRWYSDRAGTSVPQGWALSLPLWSYRALMLAWSLWLAFALLGWLRWGWTAMQQGGLWRTLPPRSGKSGKGRDGNRHSDTNPPATKG